MCIAMNDVKLYATFNLAMNLLIRLCINKKMFSVNSIEKWETLSLVMIQNGLRFVYQVCCTDITTEKLSVHLAYKISLIYLSFAAGKV